MRRTSHGFSLMEALIAVAILGMIGMLAYGTFARSMQARDKAEQITAHYHEIRQALLRMSNEISMAYISKHRDYDDPRTETIFIGKRSGGGMRLDFASFSHTKVKADANESDENELSYFVGRDPDVANGQALIRREQARIDEEPEEGGVETPILSGVTDLRFEFYDAKEDRWLDDWDTKSQDFKDRLPMFVKIELKVKDLTGTKDEAFVVKTRIFLQKRIYVTGWPFVPKDQGSL